LPILPGRLEMWLRAARPKRLSIARRSSASRGSARRFRRMVATDEAVIADNLPLLRLPRGASKEQAFKLLEGSAQEAQHFAGVDASLLDCELDTELADKLLEFCAALPNQGCVCRLAHNDLSSGTDTEQRLFERIAERELRERELRFNQELKKKASNQKDFAVSAAQRRTAEDGIAAATARLAALDEEVLELNRKKKEAPWYMLCSTIESRGRNTISCLDLTDCGLHATGLVMLAQVLLELEHRADSSPVTELILDGNDVGDIGMSAVTSIIRLSSSLTSLILRNVGITERGVSQVLAGLVNNKTLKLIDLRSNGLADLEVGKAACVGVRQFNPVVEILLE